MMHVQIIYKALILILFLWEASVSFGKSNPEEHARQVISRVAGVEIADRFIFELGKTESLKDQFSVSVVDNKVIVRGSSATSLCRGAYEYLRNAAHSIISWSGTRIDLPEKTPGYQDSSDTPFKYRYYMNAVTHGYTTPFWDWARWERELDWMAVHGMNMPLIGGAHEAILFRVFQSLGLADDEILDYFSGPAHFPWNRMGEITGWDGPPPRSFFKKQIELTHKMLDRMRELEMYPIVHAFAGFVPEGLKRIYPNEEFRKLGWGGFERKVHILAPDSRLYDKIGKLFIEEWEKEFGKGAFYLADSFNEMDVPLSDDPERQKEELAAFGAAVYKPIAEANPDAVWVMQGWTFPYHRDKEGKLFWTADRLKAFFSRIPDDKLLILDMANEYNALFWKIDYSWEMYEGFFGKQWIYSFIPNMGGKVPYNGVLDFYASAPQLALEYKDKKNLVGFGFAPEGIENNEVIYELLSDWGWTTDPIDLDAWLEMYCLARYGAYPEPMKEAWSLFRKSCFGTFTDHPRFLYQFRPGESHQPTVHYSDEFRLDVRKFIEAAEFIDQGNLLYQYDAIELAVQYFGHLIDENLKGFLAEGDDQEAFEKAIEMLGVCDTLLASHPNHRLQNWVDLARNCGDSREESDYYESNAKRLITTWGGIVNDYSARVWHGLLAGYYRERWIFYKEAYQEFNKSDLLKWEEQWIKTPWQQSLIQYDDPIAVIKAMITEYGDQ